MAVATHSPHVQEKRARRRDAIVQAALQAFRDRGYHSTTLEDIAARLGIRKTALYHYFPDKESILFHCHQLSLGQLERVLSDAQSRFDRAADQLRYLIREHTRMMTERFEAAPSAFEVSALTREHQQIIIEGRDRYERGLRDIIHRGVARGEFRPVDGKTATFAILGAINWVAQWYRPGGELHGSGLGADYADLMVGGLTCP